VVRFDVPVVVGRAVDFEDGGLKRFVIIAGLAESLLNFRGPLIEALRDAGLEVHTVAPKLHPGSAIRAELEAKGIHAHDVPLRRTGTNPMADVQFMFALWRLLRRIRPDYVMGYTIKPVIYGTIAAALAGVPNRFALITGLGYAFQGNGQRKKLQTLAQYLYTIALKKTKKVFFQNPDDEALFRQLGILAPDAATAVTSGSGVNLDQYAPAPLPTGAPRFLLIARLLGDKGVREYVQAALRARARHPDAVFTLVGPLDENPDSISHAELQQWIEAGTIDYLGEMRDVRPAIAAATVYVLPSYREGTPRTVLEAMAMGRPIITTDAPGCRETVTDGENGFLVEPKSVEQLEAAILRFIREPALVGIMGGRSLQIAREKYDVHKVNDFMLREMDIK
jgi:glycosyltransferase involved in cell wall biosynthesis